MSVESQLDVYGPAGSQPGRRARDERAPGEVGTQADGQRVRGGRSCDAA